MKPELVVACLLALSGSPGNGATNTPVLASQTRFRAVEVFVDSRGEPLAAYQLEVSATPGTVRIVGIEGGSHAAYQEPPFHDPKAIQRERVILAAFSTRPADELPKDRTRVATIHYQTPGAEAPTFRVKLVTAAAPDGRQIHAEVETKPKEDP